MDFKSLQRKAKQLFDKRGGIDALKADADELKDIAKGPGSVTDKAKRAGDALKDPGAKGPDILATDAPPPVATAEPPAPAADPPDPPATAEPPAPAADPPAAPPVPSAAPPVPSAEPPVPSAETFALPCEKGECAARLLPLVPTSARRRGFETLAPTRRSVPATSGGRRIATLCPMTEAL